MNDSTKFEIVGSVKDKFVATSGKFASVTVETSINGRRSNYRIKCFDGNVIRQVDGIGAGEFVLVTGYLGSETVKDKAHNAIQVDGRNVWVTLLVGESVEPAAGNVATANKHAPPRHSAPTKSAPKPPIEDDDIPF